MALVIGCARWKLLDDYWRDIRAAKVSKDRASSTRGETGKSLANVCGGKAFCSTRRPIILDVYATAERSISIFIELRKAGLIFIPLAVDTEKARGGFAGVTIRWETFAV